jgi:hypothetical protein
VERQKIILLEILYVVLVLERLKVELHADLIGLPNITKFLELKRNLDQRQYLLENLSEIQLIF